MSRTPTSVNLEDDHADWLDRQNINRSDFINDLIKQYRKNEGRIEEAIQEFRAEQLLEEADELESDGEQKLRKAERKREKAREYLEQSESLHEQAEAELEEARESLVGNVELKPTNPAVENWADKLGMTPVELVDQLEGDD